MTEENTHDAPETPEAPEAADTPPPAPTEPPAETAADEAAEENMAEELAEELAAEVESELAEEITEVEVVEEAAVDFEALTAQHEEETKAKDAALQAAQDANWELSDKIEGLESQVADLQSQLAAANAERDGAKAAQDTAETARAAADQTVEALQTQLKALDEAQEAQRDRLTQIADLEAEASRLRRAQNEKQATIDELTRRNRTLADEIGGLTRSLAAMGDQVEALKTDRDTYKKKVDDVDKTIKKMRRRTKLLSGGGALALLYAIIKR